MSGPVTASFGSWSSPITSDLIVADSISLYDVLLDGDDTYWVEGRPNEAGRYVLVRCSKDGRTADATPIAPFNARTRVHEYGGGASCVRDGVVYTSNYQDQRLYRIAPGKDPVPLTPPPPNPDAPDTNLRYADGLIDVSGNLWIGVREDHLDKSRLAVNTLVVVDLRAGGAGTELVRGNDFYSSPRLSPDGRRLAWLTWNHPNMPWVGTELWVADFTGAGVANAEQVAGGASESVFQPEWAPDGRLYFISDRSGWWNLYRREADGSTTAVCPRQAEFGEPQWNFGMSTYAFLSPSRAVCTYTEAGLGRFGLLDLATGQLTQVDLPFTEYGAVRAAGGRVVFRAGSPNTPASVVAYDPATSATTVLQKSTAVADDPAVSRYITSPRPVKFPTSGGRFAYGLFYPPHNPDFTGPRGERPPPGGQVPRRADRIGVQYAQPWDPILDQPRSRRDRCRLRRQHGVRAGIPGAVVPEVGDCGRGRLRGRGPLPG